MFFGDDLNETLDFVIGRSCAPLFTRFTSREVIKHFMSDLGLEDICRIVNPIKTGYRFFQHLCIF